MSKVYKAKVPPASTKAAGSYTESAGTLGAVEGSSSGPAPSDESAQLEELGIPSTHICGAPFVLNLDENIEEAKEEFKEFIFARFQGDIPSKGRVIGVVNAVWARNGPRIFVHRVGHRCFLLKVTNERTRNVLLSRPAWMIAGSPMFVAPWSSDFSKEEPQLTTAVIPVELHGVPYLLFNKQSLSRLTTAIRKPESLAPETERKENFEVAKIWVWVSLLTDLPDKIITGFSNGCELGVHVLLLFISKMTLDVLTYLESIVVVLEKTTVVLEVDSLEETDDPGVLALYLLKVIIIVGKGVQLWRLTLRLRTQVVTQLGMHEPSKSYLLQEMSHMSMGVVDNTSENEDPGPKRVISLDRHTGHSSISVFYEANEPSPAHGTPSTAALINRSTLPPRQVAVIKLIFQSTIYALWRERGVRETQQIFTAVSTNAPGLPRALDRQIRDRLISFPSPDTSPSMLEFYFSYIQPPSGFNLTLVTLVVLFLFSVLSKL
ncbi:hypothetical protein Bca101_071008 [Brassica carinata]